MLAEGEDTVPESGEDLTVGATHGLSHRTKNNVNDYFLLKDFVYNVNTLYSLLM